MAKTKTVKHLNHDRIVKLYKKLDKSVSAVAKRVGASYMGVRRVLILEKALKA